MFFKIFKRINNEVNVSINEGKSKYKNYSFESVENKLQELLNNLPLTDPLHEIPTEYSISEYRDRYSAFFIATDKYILRHIPNYMLSVRNEWRYTNKVITSVEINRALYDSVFPLKNSKKKALGSLISTLKSIHDDAKDAFYETHYESIMNVIELISKLGNEEDLELEKLLAEWISELIEFARALNKDFSKETLGKIKMELEFAKLQNKKLATEI